MQEEVKQLLDTYQVTLEKKTIQRSGCEVLDRSKIYKLSKEDNFIISRASLIEEKPMLQLKNGYIEYVEMKSLKVKKAVFINVFFDETTIKQTSLQESIFINCTLKNVKILNTDLRKSIFINCEFENTSISDTKMTDAKFYGCNDDRITYDGEADFISFELLGESSNEEANNNEKIKFEGIIKSDQLIVDRVISKMNLPTASSFLVKVNFIQCIFDARGLFVKNKYMDCNFTDVIFKKGISQNLFDHVEFFNVTFNGIIDNCHFKNCNFEHIVLEKGTRFEECVFKDCTGLDAFKDFHFENCKVDGMKYSNVEVLTIKQDNLNKEEPELEDDKVILPSQKELSKSPLPESSYNDGKALKRILMSVLVELGMIYRSDSDKKNLEVIKKCMNYLGTSDRVTGLDNLEELPLEELKHLFQKCSALLMGKIQ